MRFKNLFLVIKSDLFRIDSNEPSKIQPFKKKTNKYRKEEDIF